MPDSRELTDISSQLKKTVISSEKFKRGSSFDTSKSIINIHKTISSLAGHTRKLAIRLGSVEKSIDNNSRKISILKNLSEKQSERIGGNIIGSKLPGSSTSNIEDNISAITKSVSSIAEILSGRKRLADATSAYEKRKAEQEKRALAESKLEKRFKGLKREAEKVISPIKSILDRILEFFTTVVLGRVVFKLIEWFGNKNNSDKVKSIIRFLGDHWPKLLTLYLTFGTSFGRFARGLVKLVARSAFKLGALILRLTAAKKSRGARQLAGFLGGRGGKVVSAAVGTAVTLGGTYALTQSLKGSGEEETQKTQEYKGGGYVIPKIPTFKGGGYVIPKIPTFKGGGINFKGMLGGASLGAMFGPLGMLLGGAFGSGKPQEVIGGFVSGEKGVDKVPAMLSDGEFVMSRGAVAKYGVDTLEAMNAAGGGTNRPKIVSGTAYAATGGLIGNEPNPDPSYNDPILDRRLNLMKSLENYARSQASSGGDLNLIRALNNLAFTLKGYKNTSFDSPSLGMYSGPNLSGLANQLEGLPKTGLNIANQAYGAIRNVDLQRDLLGYGQEKLKEIKSTGTKILGDVKTSAINIVDSPFAALEKYGTERENALIKSGELKPGAALTKTMQANLEKRDAWIKSLYDPEKDKGAFGNVKKIYQDIQNRGLTPDLTAMMGLKSEGFEKFVEKATGGKVKNFGAKLTGLQYAVKGLMGPLGKAFRIDDGGSLGRYVRPAIIEAQRRGQGGVGAVGLGQKDYDRLMGDRLANLALGQFNFNVDKRGRATTDDTYEANKPASEYFKNARSNLRSGKIGPAIFQAVSGILRINQNTGWGNLRPGGAGIDLGGGFTPTDDKGMPIPPTKTKSPVTIYPPNDPRRKNTGQPYKSRFARPKNAGVKPVSPPTSTKPKVVYGPPVPSSKPKYRGKGARSKTKTPSFNASSNSKAKMSILGITI